MISVIVIGAGLAALLAGNELSRKGFDVQILEAGDTVSRPRADVKLPYQLIWEAPLVQSNGKLVPITSAARLRSTINMILNLSERRLQAANGTLADFIKDEFESALRASTKDLDPELAFEYLRHFEKIQCTRFCFDTFFDASKRVFPFMKSGRSQRSYNHLHGEVKVTPTVQLKKKVVKIKINSGANGDKAVVQTEDGAKLEADHVIVGLPLGVLKESYTTLFEPALPQAKINAIQGLGVGVVNIIGLEFQKPIVKSGWTGVNFLWTDRDLQFVKNSSFSWVLGIIGFYPVGNETSQMWAVNQGKDAIDMEAASKSALTEGFAFLLSRFLDIKPVSGGNGNIKMKITANKPYANHRGSFAYESVTAELFETSHDDFKEPVLDAQSKPVIWFTGELVESEEAAVGLVTAKSILSYQKTKKLNFLQRNPPQNVKLHKDVDVLILGGGSAGIAAARTLKLESNATFAVLEADYKLGGRIMNQPMVNSDPEIKDFAVVAAGAQWLHGTDNPLYEYAKTKKMILKEVKSPDMGNFFFEDGQIIEKKYVDGVMGDVGQILDKAENFYKKRLRNYPPNLDFYLTSEFEKTIKSKPRLERFGRQILDWHKRFYIVESGASSLESISAKEWGRYENKQHHISVKTGLAGLLKTMADEVGQEHFLRHKSVQKIHWASNLQLGNLTRKILVQCKDGSLYAANHVIVTFSLGVLKQDFGSLFLPKIPLQYRASIDCIGFGSIGKIFLQFDEKWWEGSGIHFIYRNATYDDNAPWTRWLLGFKTFEGLKSTLLGWVGGKGNEVMETLSDFEVIEDVVRLLGQFTQKPVPYPRRYSISRWGNNILTKGSFSYTSVDCDAVGLHHSDLVKPITSKEREFSYSKYERLSYEETPADNLLLFAGEGSSNRAFSTSHGAFVSGQEQARKVIP